VRRHCGADAARQRLSPCHTEVRQSVPLTWGPAPGRCRDGLEARSWDRFLNDQLLGAGTGPDRVTRRLTSEPPIRRLADIKGFSGLVAIGPRWNYPRRGLISTPRTCSESSSG